MSIMDRVRMVLTPARRKAVYDLVPVAMAALVAAGLFTEQQGVLVGGVAVSLGVLVMAVLNASGYRQAIYGFAAAVAAVLTGWGIVSGELAGHALAVVSAVLGVILAGSNTDPSTATGVPANEF